MRLSAARTADWGLSTWQLPIRQLPIRQRSTSRQTFLVGYDSPAAGNEIRGHCFVAPCKVALHRAYATPLPSFSSSRHARRRRDDVHASATKRFACEEDISEVTRDPRPHLRMRGQPHSGLRAPAVRGDFHFGRPGSTLLYTQRRGRGPNTFVAGFLGARNRPHKSRPGAT
jgi:hypothetical protein